VTSNSGRDNISACDLRPGCLSQLEAVSQSVAGIAPTATLAMIVPLLVRTAGQAAWVPFLIAMIGVLCLANQINVFARKWPSAGSLYSYVYRTSGRVPGVITGWSLLIAYIATAAAAIAGFVLSVQSLLDTSLQASFGVACGLIFLCAATGVFLVYCDVKLSARLMLLIEFCSVALMILLFCWPGPGSVWHFSHDSIKPSPHGFQAISSGVVLAMFSFAGFESAACLGPEVAEPSRAVPRALKIAVVVTGLLFMFAAYAEYQAFQQSITALEGSNAPLQALASSRGMAGLTGALLIGSAASFFACVLACVTAASRALMQMSRDGHVLSRFGSVHPRHKTPYVAIAATAPFVILPVFLLLVCRATLLDIYGWLGTMATVGFVIPYLLTVIAAVFTAHLKPTVSVASCSVAVLAGAMLLTALWGSLFESAGWITVTLLSIFVTAVISGVTLSLFVARRNVYEFDS
jgi:amino acid transporter